MRRFVCAADSAGVTPSQLHEQPGAFHGFQAAMTAREPLVTTEFTAPADQIKTERAKQKPSLLA